MKKSVKAVPFFVAAFLLASSELAQEFLNEPYDSDMGLKGLFFGEEGFRHFFSVYPLKDITSLKGQKIRVAADPIIKKFARSQKSGSVV